MPCSLAFDGRGLGPCSRLNQLHSIVTSCLSAFKLQLFPMELKFLLYVSGGNMLIIRGLQQANWTSQTGDERCNTWSRQHQKWYQCIGAKICRDWTWRRMRGTDAMHTFLFLNLSPRLQAGLPSKLFFTCIWSMTSKCLYYQGCKRKILAVGTEYQMARGYTSVGPMAPFYVFPCGHAFHAQCLIAHVTRCTSEAQVSREYHLLHSLFPSCTFFFFPWM